MRTNIPNIEHYADYIRGYDSKLAEIYGMGWEHARDKFNADYPQGHKPANMGAYYYANGEIDALEDEINAWLNNPSQC